MSPVLVEIDVLASFLGGRSHEIPLLRRLLTVVPCYSTFVQAAELYATAASDREREWVTKALFGVRVLGVHSRYSKTIGQIYSSLGTAGGLRHAIVAAIAIENRLPIVTDAHYDALTRVTGLRLLRASHLSQLPEESTLTKALAGSS